MRPFALASVASLFLALAGPAHALTITDVRVPASVAPGAPLSVTWRTTSTSRITHTNIHWGTVPGSYDRTSTVRSGFATGTESWGGTVTAPSFGTVHLVIHAQDASGANIFSSRFAVPVGGGAPFGLDARVRNDTAFIRVTDEPAGGSWTVERVFPGLSFRAMTGMVHANDGTGRLYVVERVGLVTRLSRVSNPATETPTRSTFLDIRSRTRSTFGNEEGLLSIAFHPHFHHNGQVFACYTTGRDYNDPSSPVRTRVSRFHLNAGGTALDPALEEVLIEVRKSFFNHNGGQLAFGPDGMLYVGIGDGGGGSDPERTGQNLGTLKGKVLRLDVDGGTPYRVPADNPFVGRPGARGEIWAYGIRNPWRFSFDRTTGRLWLGDVGQNAWEEIDIIQKGGNYGWSVWEGKHVHNGGTAAGHIQPVIEYSQQVGGRCIIGGYVYRGTRLPRLQGVYLYADYTSGNIWGAKFDGQAVTENTRLVSGTTLTPSSFAEDEAGEVYILSYKEGGGGIYRLALAGATASVFPQRLSQTNLFSNLATQTMRRELLPYGVSTQLWSDHALKQRYMAVPRLDRVQRTAEGGWVFPNETTLVKHFWLERRRGDPATKRIVETRLLVKLGGQWRGYSYEWNDAGTDGFLLPDSKRRTYAVEVNGVQREQQWYFPARGECFRCHTDAAGTVLGPTTRQLNSDYDYAHVGGRRDNQLRTLDHIGLFTTALTTTPASLPKLFPTTNAAATLEQKARSYLHVNCSSCHRPGGGAPVAIDLRIDTPLASTGILDAIPQAGDLGIAGARIVKRGDPDGSVLLRRMLSTGEQRMPPLGTSVVDEAGTSVVREWIRSLGN